MSWAERFALALPYAGAFAAGALATAVLAALVGALLRRGLEPRGHQLDRWRRVWFHPERELARFAEALLVLGWLLAYGERFGFPCGALLAVYGAWTLHLVPDARSYWALHRAPTSTRQLHRRGFFLLDYGPLPLRLALAALAAAAGFLLPLGRRVLVTAIEPLAAVTQAWFF
ncbi:MAG: hypothetical protein ACE5MH_07280 [Terriglobia bacterium]